MITQSSIPYITQMLDEPHLLSEADNEMVTAMVEAFPYFVPARYMEAAGQHRKEPFASSTMSMMQLYRGNWLLYWQFLQDALGEQAMSTDTLKEKMSEEQYGEHKFILEEEEILHVEDTFVAPEVEEIVMAEKPTYIFEEYKEEPVVAENDETLILPIYTEDYFLHQGIHVSNDIPAAPELNEADKAKSLMVVMSFSEWLMFYKTRSMQEKEEQEDQRALKSMWQKEKLAAALEEENEEIPENVFEMAMNSISVEDDLVSESLAEIYIKQEKYDRAIEMYRKLRLRNPQKNAYFARKIESVLKAKEL